jgi:hypothetical protein
MQTETTEAPEPRIATPSLPTPRYKGVYAMMLFIVAAYLALVRLDNTVFWDDEAHIAIMARNFLHTGTWTGWDGRNLLAYGNGIVLEPNLRHIIPQLDAPLMALSFALFGVSTWAGRFPFVVAGLLSLVVFAALLRKQFAKQNVLQVFSFATLAFSVHFLLSIRTCRYYALAILLALLVFNAYRCCLERKRTIDFVILGLWAILLFLTSCLNAAAFLLALATVHIALHRRDWAAREWKNAALAVTVFLLGAVPYAVVNRIWDFPLATTQPWYQRKTLHLISNVGGLNWIGLPWVVILGLVGFMLYRYQVSRRRQEAHGVSTRNGIEAASALREAEVHVFEPKVREWAVLVLAYVFFLSMLAPAEINVSNDDALRYLYIILPWTAGLCGAFLWFVAQRMKLLAIALCFVLIGTNLLSLPLWGGMPRFSLTDYIAEVHQPYPTSYSEVVSFLQKHARFDDKVLAVPHYTNYPLMFYVGDHVRFSALLNRKTHLSIDTVRALPAPLLFEENFPDWYVSFGTWPMTKRDLRFFSRPHVENGRRIAYSYRLFRTLDVFYEQTHRPEIPWHSFGPHRNFNRSKNAVYIYRRSAPRVLGS